MLIDCGCLLKRSNMKIAIKGHESRGKEVIQILESLGGIDKWNHIGGCVNYAYYIDHCNNIYSFGISGYHGDRKIYTLEEFEKEFPFKIGDMVTVITNTPYKIVALEYYMGRLCYRLDNGLNYSSESLKPYKEMKEERNITLTLDKAKEWFNKGGELKEIALQAFSEKELNPLPRSLEEFYKQGNPVASWRYNIPIKYDALFKLEQLRNCWRQGWEPNWDNVTQTKYYICCCRGEFKISTLYETRCFLTFPTREMAEEFLECFRDLIEKAGDLI